MTLIKNIYIVGGMAMVTFLIRNALLPFSSHLYLSPGVKRALGYVPPSVLMAIMIPMILMPDRQTIRLSPANPYLMGAIATALIGWWSKNLLVTVAGGMVFFLSWQWLFKIS